MINVELFMLGLLITSVLTGLTTEAVKNILIEHNATYRANTLAGIIALILSERDTLSRLILDSIHRIFCVLSVLYL